jgi:hypothetical protein
MAARWHASSSGERGAGGGGRAAAEEGEAEEAAEALDAARAVGSGGEAERLLDGEDVAAAPFPNVDLSFRFNCTSFPLAPSPAIWLWGFESHAEWNEHVQIDFAPTEGGGRIWRKVKLVLVVRGVRTLLIRSVLRALIP